MSNLKYLKEYKLRDMQEMARNNRTPHHRTLASLAGKTVVISGATSGVGLAAAREAARFHANLVLLARNPEKARIVKEELQGVGEGTVSLFIGDLSRLTDAHRLANEVTRTAPRIDVLINSAGLFSTRRIHTDEGHELVFCVNHLAAFVLTQRLIPIMRRAGAGRIIQVSSQGHRFNGLALDDLDWRKRIYTGLRGYGASKTAQLLSVWELADRLAGTGVTVNAMHPGAVRTAIGTNNGRLYRWYQRHVIGRFLKDVRISGESLHYLAAAPEVAGISGAYFNRTHPEKPAPHALDRAIGRELWAKTMELTGLDHEI
jgi:retinol dehydrogenase 13